MAALAGSGRVTIVRVVAITVRAFVSRTVILSGASRRDVEARPALVQRKRRGMSSHSNPRALAQRPICAGRKNRDCPSAPGGCVHSSVSGDYHSVRIPLGRQPLHHSARGEIHNRYRVAEVLSCVQSSSVGRKCNAGRIASSVLPFLPYGQCDAVCEAAAATAPVESVYDSWSPPDTYSDFPSGLKTIPRKHAGSLDGLNHTPRASVDDLYSLLFPIR